MIKNLLLLSLLFLCFSCNDIDDEILPIVGVYQANVVGVAGPFSMSVSTNGQDEVIFEAPFDGDIWDLVRADIDFVENEKWDIDISRQTLAPNVEIWGEGFYHFGNIQLNYTMRINGKNYTFKLVATK